jgi:hypothetical protein
MTPDAARSRLLAVLADLARDATASALERCPYRDHDDTCTFPGGCRNQLRSKGTAVLRCSGAPLNPTPISISTSNSKGCR